MAKVIDFKAEDDFDKVIQDNKDKPIFVDFYADWCGPCKKLGPQIDKVVEELQCVLIKVNVDENYKLAEKFNISSIPKVVLYKNGEKADEFNGYSPKELEKLKNSCK
jgi:thioredoxin 1